jgi:hypothetical protein
MFEDTNRTNTFLLPLSLKECRLTFLRSDLTCSSYSKNFIIVIYFHSGLVYHIIYFNNKLKFSIFSQIFWIRQTDQSRSQESQTTSFVGRREYNIVKINKNLTPAAVMAHRHSQHLNPKRVWILGLGVAWSLNPPRPCSSPAEQDRYSLPCRIPACECDLRFYTCAAYT